MLRAMAWKKPSAALVETFDAVLPGPPAERRLMFGFPAGFVNGNMFMGLYEEQLLLRLDEGPRQALVAGGATPFEPMKGRPMREYVVAPAALVADRAALVKWVRQAFAYGRSLPPKPKKPAKSGPTPTPKKLAKSGPTPTPKKPAASRATGKGRPAAKKKAT